MQLRKNTNLILVSFSTYLQVPCSVYKKFQHFSLYLDKKREKNASMLVVDFNESLTLILLNFVVLVSIASLPAAAFIVLILHQPSQFIHCLL
jgi:hypothetical protein